MGDPLVDRLRLKFPQLARRLEGQPHRATRSELPFYRRHALVTLTVEAPRLTRAYHYLDDGVELYALEAAGDVAAANARERLQVVPQHAEAYARFALLHGLGLQVVERPDQLPWHPDAPAERKEQAVRALRPLRLVISPEGGFEVTAVLNLRRDLVERRYRLTVDGVLERRAERVLVADIPIFPPNF